jgi:hypothetical protein
MPEHKKSTLKTLLKNHIETIVRKHPKLKLIHLADGAQDNWSYFDDVLPHGFQITDFYHVCEHLKQGFDAAYGKENAKATEQFVKYKTLLRDEVDGIEKVIRTLRYLRDKDKNNTVIKDTLTYFTNNAHRMQYAKAKALNYPIGSGVVEASCKTLVGQRMKRSGMAWCHHGGQAILTFRSLVKSGRFDTAWNVVATCYKKTVIEHANVVAFPGKSFN